MSRSGYTLPVFACAAAVAALEWLRQHQSVSVVCVNLIEPNQMAEIPIEQVAGLSENMALAITNSDPGDNLDLTRNTPIWALVEWREDGEQEERVMIKGGEGVGRIVDDGGKPAIYAYAHRVLQENLQALLPQGKKITVTIILPKGRSLAVRTSNAAFGVVEGLSLLGTTGISQPLSTPGQLEAFRQDLQHKASRFDCLVFCIGENGLDLAQKLGIHQERLIKTANWLGPMLVEAALQSVKEILLFGYHGKLMKLAGGIFHTHHHLADGRREILVSHCAKLGLPTSEIQIVFDCPTAEESLKYLRLRDNTYESDYVNQVYSAIAEQIDTRSVEYIKAHTSEHQVLPIIGSILFDRDREIIVQSKTGCTLIRKLC